jgi:hypothetical protein
MIDIEKCNKYTVILLQLKFNFTVKAYMFVCPLQNFRGKNFFGASRQFLCPLTIYTSDATGSDGEIDRSIM